LAVGPRIDPDLHAFRNAALLVDDAALEDGMAADVGAGQDDRILDRRPAVYIDAGEEQRALHRRAGNDAAASDQRIDGGVAPAVVIEHELGRRQLLLIGPDRPVTVIHI